MISPARIALALFSCAVVVMASSKDANAALSSGADGLFRPLSDITLTVPDDGIFNFTEIDIGSGITVNLEGPAASVSWLATGDIRNHGSIFAPGWAFTLITPTSFSQGQDGSISASHVLIQAPVIQLSGTLTAHGSAGSGPAGGTVVLCSGGTSCAIGSNQPEGGERIPIDGSDRDFDVEASIAGSAGTISVTTNLGSSPGGGTDLRSGVQITAGPIALSGPVNITVTGATTTGSGGYIVMTPVPVPLPGGLLLMVSALPLLIGASGVRRFVSTSVRV